MSYIVIEIQKSGEGAVATIVTTFEDLNQAESKYHAILSAAAISALQVHSAALLNEAGYLIRSQSYTHPEHVTPEEIGA